MDTNPATPMSVLAKKRNVCCATISKSIKDLGIPHARSKKFISTAQMKKVRLECGVEILHELTGVSAGHLKFFLDENIFTTDRSRKARYDGWIDVDKSQVQAVLTTKNPAGDGLGCPVQ